MERRWDCGLTEMTNESAYIAEIVRRVIERLNAATDPAGETGDEPLTLPPAS